jgi:hypothetical protein
VEISIYVDEGGVNEYRLWALIIRDRSFVLPFKAYFKTLSQKGLRFHAQEDIKDNQTRSLANDLVTTIKDHFLPEHRRGKCGKITFKQFNKYSEKVAYAAFFDWCKVQFDDSASVRIWRDRGNLHKDTEELKRKFLAKKSMFQIDQQGKDSNSFAAQLIGIVDYCLYWKLL